MTVAEETAEEASEGRASVGGGVSAMAGPGETPAAPEAAAAGPASATGPAGGDTPAALTPADAARLADEGYAPLMAALSAYGDFMRGFLMKKRRGLTKTQVDAMVSLSFTGKAGMSELAGRLGVSKEQATRTVAPLVERGLVCRARDPERYRVVEVSLTERGRALLLDIRAQIDAEVGERLSSLSDEDQARLLEASRTAAAILRKLGAGDPLRGPAVV